MKLLRWALGGASAYVIYKYSIGRKARGEDVFVTAEKAVGEPVAPSRPAVRKAPVKRAAKAKDPADAADAPVAQKPKPKPAPRRAKPKARLPE